MSIFSGIWIPLVTPFSNGRIDHDALRNLVKSYIEAKVSGFVALGTTGEPSSLDHAEQEQVLATILNEAKNLPVVVGLAGNNAMELRERALRLNELPIAGLLVPAPYYVRPSQIGLTNHFTTLADTSKTPLIVYDIPYRTGVRLDIATLLTLAGHPNIHAIKDCAGSLETTLALILDGRLSVLAGEDLNMFSTLCLGGHGAIAASAHVRAADFVAVYNDIKAGRIDEARARFHRLVPLIQALVSEPNPAPVKCALEVLGMIRQELRAPMTQATDRLRNQLGALLSS
ncbi:4-hydroxy-tetrahydrodipicolinate synthase [Caballeronia sp. dw_19]|uniref:4-hydroxy-tetrahydrodipicolinate synthase n=1 Tax=Caballeronia sp. dw_19 TaxID=2719791 RepID=UPI001BD530E2|nr:4-hydroxy-tetrahydrodipicolinate synthase [Caballeronia sp. dw_19]